MSNSAVMSHILAGERVLQFLTSSKGESTVNVAVDAGVPLFSRCTTELSLFRARHLY